jgi:hypothetical protein
MLIVIYAECGVIFIILLSVVMMNGIILSVVKMNAIILSVVAPY